MDLRAQAVEVQRAWQTYLGIRRRLTTKNGDIRHAKAIQKLYATILPELGVTLDTYMATLCAWLRARGEQRSNNWLVTPQAVSIFRQQRENLQSQIATPRERHRMVASPAERKLIELEDGARRFLVLRSQHPGYTPAQIVAEYANQLPLVWLIYSPHRVDAYDSISIDRRWEIVREWQEILHLGSDAVRRLNARWEELQNLEASWKTSPPAACSPSTMTSSSDSPPTSAGTLTDCVGIGR